MTAKKRFSSTCPIQRYGPLTFPNVTEWETELINPFLLPENFSLKKGGIITTWKTETGPHFYFDYHEDTDLMPKKSIIIKVFSANTEMGVNQQMQNFELQTLAEKMIQSQTTGLSSSIPFMPIISLNYFLVAVYKRSEGY
jgi:hypothetical protein